MKYCITIEQLNGQPKSHAVHFFPNFVEAHAAFLKRCQELGYDYTELPDGIALMSSCGVANDYRIELSHSNFAFLINEDEEVVS
jgi:hypothetical protein